MIRRVIQLGRGAQPWPHVPKDARARPTRVASATYTIVDATRSLTASDREVVAETTVNVDAVSTTTTADAGSNTAQPAQLSIASGADIVEGHTYLLTASDGTDREAIVCKSVGALSFVAMNPVKGVYPSGSTLQGVELTATFPEAWADDEDRLLQQGRSFEIAWQYTIAGVVMGGVEPIPVERHALMPWIDEDYLLTGRRALRDRLEPDDAHSAIVAATRKVIAELEASPHSAESFRATEMGRHAVCDYALHVIYANFSGEEDRGLAEAHLDAYKVQIHQIVQGRNAGAKVVDKETGVARPVYDDLRIFTRP